MGMTTCLGNTCKMGTRDNLYVLFYKKHIYKKLSTTFYSEIRNFFLSISCTLRQISTVPYRSDPFQMDIAYWMDQNGMVH